MKTKQNTNSMKNILLTMLLFTGIVEAQIVSIPDANFKAKLLAADVTNTIASTATNATIPDTFNKIDANNDGEIQQSEAAAVTLLDVSNSNIADLTGIEEFVNLHKLKCNGNQLTNLNIDLSNILVWLDCQDNNLTSLNITDKIYLQLLFCNNNQLSNLTLSNLPSLANLYCDNNQLTSLNLNGLTALVLLGCSNNQLSSINFSGLSSIEYVNCLNNVPLTTIDLAGHTSLTSVLIGSNDILNPSINFNTVDLSGTSIINLTISNSIINTLNLNNCANLIGLNLLSNLIPNVILTGCNAIQLLDLRCSPNSLDVTNMLDLQYLDITGSNTIPSLDLSNNINLYSLKCDEYNPETLDLSNNINLAELFCASNNLKYLFIKNGSDLPIDNLEWTFGGSPNLLYACVDESELSIIESIAVFPTTVIGTYCSFTPGGNYNTITGNIKYDADNNGCDAADLPQTNIRVNINDGAITGASFSSDIGNYAFFTQAGSFEIIPSIENASWFNFSPATATIPFADNNNNTATQDFCLTPNGIHPDIEVVISPVFFARPGFDATYQITYRNKGNQTVSGTINLTFDDSRTDFVSANPLVDNLAVNSLSWNYNNLLPFESRTITFVFNVNSPMEIPAVNIGDILTFQATISPLDLDENPQDNSFTLDQTVVGSYDPNSIICLEGDVVPPTEIGNYLHYAINFENTGTFPAENVVVKTEVDAAKFDIGSLQLMNSNFPVDARITGNKVEFIYENIQLPIGGHGHILLKIKTQNTLVAGDAVANRGDIFFDYNFPIDTGLANTLFQGLLSTISVIDNSVALYPNPVIDDVTISADNKIKSIQLYDAQGRIILTRLMDDLESKIELSSYSKGIYFIKITTEKGAQVQKLIKE